MPDDPNWPKAAAWLNGAHADAACSLAVLGAPLCLGSITPGRTDLAPAAIRAILSRLSTYDLEFDRDLGYIAVTDLGDLPIADLAPADAFELLAAAVRSAVAKADAMVLL